MRTLGQLLICVLLAVTTMNAAVGPWDLDSFGTDRAAAMARAFERHLATQSDRLALYLEVPSAQLRAVAELPLLRELASALRLREVGRLLLGVPGNAPTPCVGRDRAPGQSS